MPVHVEKMVNESDMTRGTTRDSLISARISVVGFLMSCVIAAYHCRVIFTNLSPVAKLSNELVDSFVDQIGAMLVCACIVASSALLCHGLKRFSPRVLSLLTGGR